MKAGRSRGRFSYDTWYEHVGRPNKIPYRARGGARRRPRGPQTPRLMRHDEYGTLYAVGDDVVTIACGNRSTPAQQDVQFGPSVEDWRDLVSSYAGSIPVNFLLAWIQIESCGSACSFTSGSEAGIFQLMPPDNIAKAGTTLAAIHPQPPCGPGNSFVPMSSLTDDQQVEQVASGLQYVNYVRDVAHQKLAAAGQDWSEETPDFWMLVKLQHAWPATTAPALALAAAQLGRPPENWSEFLMGASSNTPANSLSNAQWTGSFGIGGGGGGFTSILLLLGLGYLAYRLSA